MCYSPLGSPRRLEKNPADPVVMEDPVINEIATKHKATAAQVSQLIYYTVWAKFLRRVIFVVWSC